MISEPARPLIVEVGSLTRAGCIEAVDRLLQAAESGCQAFVHTTPIVQVSEDLCAADGGLVVQVPLGLTAVGVAAALVQAPLSLRGRTDSGKTFFSALLLGSLFGSDGFWRCELNRGMTVDDFLDIDTEKLLKGGKLSEAQAPAQWLSRPGRLLDEVNRAHPKLANLVLHLVDSTGFHLRGDLSIPVGQPYSVDGDLRRYSFTMLTANPVDADYAGTFEEDAALARRAVIAIDLDEVRPNWKNRKHMLEKCRARPQALPPSQARTTEIIRVYEALPALLPHSARATLLLHYFAAMGTCIRTRCGFVQPKLTTVLCEKCHLAKAHPYCGRAGGLGEGLLLWLKELSRALAAVRGALVLRQAAQHCVGEGPNFFADRLRQAFGRQSAGRELYERFRAQYVKQLQVSVEDVCAAYPLIAPTHIWMDANWLKTQTAAESSPFHVCRQIATFAASAVDRFLTAHAGLAERLAANGPLTAEDQNELEAVVTTEDAALLGVCSALRDEEIPLGGHL